MSPDAGVVVSVPSVHPSHIPDVLKWLGAAARAVGETDYTLTPLPSPLPRDKFHREIVMVLPERPHSETNELDDVLTRTMPTFVREWLGALSHSRNH